jgi:hypothetical protein
MARDEGEVGGGVGEAAPTPRLVLHDREDEVGLEGREAERPAQPQQSVALLGRQQRALQGLPTAQGEHPAGIGGFEDRLVDRSGGGSAGGCGASGGGAGRAVGRQGPGVGGM